MKSTVKTACAGTCSLAAGSRWLPVLVTFGCAARGRVVPGRERRNGVGRLAPVRVAFWQPDVRAVETAIAGVVAEGFDDRQDRGAGFGRAPHQGPGPVDPGRDDRALDEAGRQRGALALGRVDERPPAPADVVEERGAGDTAVGDANRAGPGLTS